MCACFRQFSTIPSPSKMRLRISEILISTKTTGSSQLLGPLSASLVGPGVHGEGGEWAFPLNYNFICDHYNHNLEIVLGLKREDSIAQGERNDASSSSEMLPEFVIIISLL